MSRLHVGVCLRSAPTVHVTVWSGWVGFRPLDSPVAAAAPVVPHAEADGQEESCERNDAHDAAGASMKAGRDHRARVTLIESSQCGD
jgi:hypothetical protein